LLRIQSDEACSGYGQPEMGNSTQNIREAGG